VESIEASGKSVDEAILQALTRLGKRRDEVDIAVLQEPSRGAFGLGSKDARVRVTVRASTTGAVITPEMADAILGPDSPDMVLSEDDLYEDEEDDEFLDDDDLYDEEDELEEAGTRVGTSFSSSVPGAGPVAQSLDQVMTDLAERGPAVAEENELQDVLVPSREDVDATVDVLQHILRYMNIHATVQVRSTNPLTLNVQGMHQNLGLLIGRRGETLTALQLLVNLIVSHRTRHRMRIIVDAENYRMRREDNLRSLALRVAQQVRNYRRSIALEAMPPHERRIVHLALSDSMDISTESIGEGDERRVVISLKRPGR
jgi:spoIIIJ-associated protein